MVTEGTFLRPLVIKLLQYEPIWAIFFYVGGKRFPKMRRYYGIKCDLPSDVRTVLLSP